ncbi:SCO family protein [Maricaulis parjimensis]|uniref:SCO family protein n=1 Tax=Maricaulis parjimensis TaxID=144023 RepID=UPI001939FC57|nr:SCO family protein [Maricaulis parjimensis]
MPRWLIWLLIVAPSVMIITFLTLMLSDQGGQTVERRAAVRTSGEAAIGGPFTLVDQTGATVTDETYRGKAMLIYFGYTYCPDVCPFSLQIMAAALDQMSEEERAQIQPILITVDPERDTPEHLAQYVASPAFPDGLIGLTGTPEQIAAVAREYRIVYQRAETETASDYLMDHSSIVYLMDSQGEFVDIFTHGTDPQAMAGRLQDFLEENSAPS